MTLSFFSTGSPPTSAELAIAYQAALHLAALLIRARR